MSRLTRDEFKRTVYLLLETDGDYGNDGYDKKLLDHFDATEEFIKYQAERWQLELDDIEEQLAEAKREIAILNRALEVERNKLEAVLREHGEDV